MIEKRNFVFAPPPSRNREATIVLSPVPPIFEDPEHTPAQRFWWKHRNCCSTPGDLKVLEGLLLEAFDEKKESREHVKLPRGERAELL